ncbi:MAG: type III pantothenate kinase [Bacteroidales bacterium]|nr:type III pantothenate kinase [Bacteroidales bacterium]
MNLAIDIGNTAVKWGAFEGRTLVAHGHGIPTEYLATAGHALLCASGEVPAELAAVPRLCADMPLPVHLNYKTPSTLGPDRIAAVCGAWSLHPGEASLVIDCGTCVTLEYIASDGTYHGGAIMPGLGMNLQALHTFTAKLPLLDIATVHKAPLLGRSTEECILAGTLGAMQLALAGYVASFKGIAPGLRVVVTGGDAERIVPPASEGREHQPHLTLIGLNEVMQNTTTNRPQHK